MLFSASSGLTDNGVLHLLTELKDLVTVKLAGKAIDKIIPSEVNNVNSNVQDVTIIDLYGRNNHQNLSQLKKLNNMRTLTVCPIQYLRDEEINEIIAGSEKLEELHFILGTDYGKICD